MEAGFLVVSPGLLDRSSSFSGNPAIKMTDQTHREWIYRQAFEAGRHLIGLEIQKVLALVDWLERDFGQEQPIGVAGYGEGGLLAFYSAAIDQRIDAALVSGYFGPRESLWMEPVYRNVWGLLKEFGDAEIASLVAPRAAVFEYSNGPEFNRCSPSRYRSGKRRNQGSRSIDYGPFS